jgi:DNA polymerase alpha subunit A
VEVKKVSMNKPIKKLQASKSMRPEIGADFSSAAEPMLGGTIGDLAGAAFGDATATGGQASATLDTSTIDPTWWLKTAEPVEGQEQGERYLNMFWTDATEVAGSIYLFGRVPVQEPGKPLRFVSGTVQIRENMRNLFVLPRELPGKFNKDGSPARAPMNEVYNEVKDMLVPNLVPRMAGALMCKPVMRKYAFEHKNVPREEAQYLKVKYNAKYPALRMEKCSGSHLKHIDRIFGSGQTVTELFLLKRRLMGPCWLRIRAPSALPSSPSFCAIEVGLDNPKMVIKEKGNMPTPPLVTMSVSMKTVCNPSTHTNEIVALSATVHTQMDCDADSAENPNVMRRFTMVRQLGQSCGQGFPAQWPHDLAQTIDRTCKGAVEVFPSERAMLAKFFMRIHQEDPDILASHNLFGFEFDILLKRALLFKLPTWNRIGRLKKSTAPRSINDRDVAAGRLLLDTYKTSKEFIRQTSYSLSALVESQLKIKREDVDPQDVPRYFHDSANIIRLASHCQSDSLLVQRLLMKLQIVPLTKQLTTCSGNLWSRTLRGARAERIEYLLSHEFHALKYVLPEKKQFEEKGKKGGGGDGDDDNAVGGMSRKRGKAAYAGGLVLEPKKGLYDTYILLLDFNSLYPSIIQEFNLCFTTIDWTKYMEEDDNSTPKPATSAMDAEEIPDVAVDSAKQLPDVPSSAAAQGVLPRVIKGLVDKRKQVKDMLKKERDVTKKQQFDIRQKALKLTANSMYGCLGFTFSKFYARPIAALVTSKGREALQRTVEIAMTTLGLDVIYGDTDSVMINTNSTDLKIVKELGNKVMQEVNKLYKALVLDMDGIFKSMLLLKKKKYAAVTITEVDGKEVLDTELKGLDLVRRDWCPLSKNTGTEVVMEILSGKPRDEIVETIHEKLRTLALEVRAGNVPLEEFVVTKGLNKLPKDYPDIKGQAHLQVALKMVDAGRPVNVGDHIPYVICVQGEEGASPPQRARHPDEVRRSQGELTLDIEWYLGNQILPPISRLCEPIEGTSIQQLTTELGLDIAKYAPRVAQDELDTEGWGFTPKSRLEDSERFRDCSKLTCVCKSCDKEVEFVGCFSKEGTSGLACHDCGSRFFGRTDAAACYSHISNRITILVNKMVTKYYDCWLKCDDHTCGRRTRQQTVRGYACTEDCHGRMVPEYSDEALYTQLKYLETLFNIKRSCAKRDLLENEGRESIPKDHLDALELLGKHMKNAVEWSGYNWVRPSLWSAVFGGGGVAVAAKASTALASKSPADKGMAPGSSSVMAV